MQPETFILLYASGVLLSFALCWHIATKYRYELYDIGIVSERWLWSAALASLLIWELVLFFALIGVCVDIVNNKE